MQAEFNKYIFFVAWEYALPIALHLQKLGKEVIVGVVDDMGAIGQGKEDPITQKIRTSNYKSVLNIVKAEKLIERMASFSNKDEWFVFCESNLVWQFSVQALKQGFTNGLFPTQFDFNIEADRNLGKEFVKKYYPQVKVADVTEFKNIQDGIDFINESEDFLALKGNDAGAITVVPTTKELDFAKEEMIDSLQKGQKDYESKGFILEKQIRDGVELCPEAIFYNGKLVATSVDFENKQIGPQNTSRHTGCMENIICALEDESPIFDIAFPPVVGKLAKRHTGMFFIDMNLIYKDGVFYYLEFCGNRPGYDSIYSEMDMSGGADIYFDMISSGMNPFQKKYGSAIRALNLARGKDYRPQGELTMRWKDEVDEHIWPFELNYKDGAKVNIGLEEDVVVFTESSDDPEYAIIKNYEVMEKFSFKELYARSKEDFLSRGYPTSILNRMDAIGKFINPPEVAGRR